MALGRAVPDAVGVGREALLRSVLALPTSGALARLYAMAWA